jgi:hypothetical protein
VQASWLLFLRIASVDEPVCQVLGGNLNTGGHFGIHLNDLGKTAGNPTLDSLVCNNLKK